MGKLCWIVYWNQTFFMSGTYTMYCDILISKQFIWGKESWYMKWDEYVQIKKKQHIYLCLKSEITTGSVETAWNPNITVHLFSYFLRQIDFALNCAIDYTDNKVLQYLNYYQYHLKWLTIHYILTPFHISILIFFQFPGRVFHTFVWQGVLHIHKCKSSIDVHCTSSTQPSHLEAVSACSYCTYCYRTSKLHISHSHTTVS